MSVTNIVRAVVKPGSVYTVTSPIMKEDKGQILLIEGLDLPEVYEIDFSNERHHGSSITMIGNADGVLIPTQFIKTGRDVFAFYYYVGDGFGQTEHTFRLPNTYRPDRTNEQPTPEEQSVIDQTIAALNDAVESTQEAQESIENMSVSAQTLSEGSSATVTKTESEGVVHLDFGIPKGQTGDTPNITASKTGKTTSIYVDGSEVAQIEDGTDGTNGDDGYSPTASVDKRGLTTTITITDKNGTTSARVMDGAPGVDGRDGYSPTAKVSKAGKVATITITDKNGTTSAQVEDGTDGTDGVSPTVTITSITGGHRITITDADGEHSADVMDGTGSVDDVQINGQSIVTDGVANVPIANASDLGCVKVAPSNGAYVVANGQLIINNALPAQIKSATESKRPITPNIQDQSAFYGLAKASGDTTQSQSSNAVGNYTEDAKSAISEMLNGSVTVSGTTPTIVAKSGIRYVCGEVATLDFTPSQTGICDVVFTSGATATVLTIPNTIKWANGFDPTALDANTTYEINIMDGLGVASAWT